MARRTPGLAQYGEIIKAHEYTIKTLCGQKIVDDAYAKDLLDRAVRVAEQRDELLAALEGCERELKDWCDYAAEHAADLIPTAQQETYAVLIQARAAIQAARDAAGERG